MSSSAVCSLFLLCCLVLSVQIQGSQAQKTFTRCGIVGLCRNESNVECRGSKCKCTGGNVGDGRIGCANPENSCVCTIAGDPMISTFTGRQFKFPLPCAHKIAYFTSTVNGIDCRVMVHGLSYDERNVTYLNTYERLIDILVFGSGISFDARLMMGEDVRTRGHVDGMDMSTSNGNTVINIPKCGVQFAYRSSGGFFSVIIGKNVKESSGMCDDCLNAGSNLPIMGSMGPLLEQLRNLDDYALFSFEEMNRYGWCKTVSSTFDSCPGDRQERAVQFCGHYLTDPNYTSCISLMIGSTDISNRASLFNDCMSDACDPAKTCTYLQALYGSDGCPTDHLAVLNDPVFCNTGVL